MRKHIPTTQLTPIALLATVGFLVTGCGEGVTEVNVDDQPSGSPSAGAGADRAETELTITLSTDPDAGDEPGLDGFTPGTWTLTCAPDGGDHPDPAAACAALASAGAEAFQPVPDGQVCTFIYGGPETATVVGHVGDTEVDSEFSRADGCEIDRWESLAPVLTPATT
ncbi:SSI family serine proteinase inhibitor [Nocardiopsis ansamitocini]|uniref:Subtilisin inhibitor domain-containing protein n=1 Tax=Nocardiopsis ansamitocini TaxID=1670832 RepID=A0A9W6PA74_9ACTN|nr:SSI family serine proteinase inhibitor [Nocardiopsis ansamitocini]GLU49869.1 hypothetical protein Nans01_42200 [Nocardiopsis ansamitocini]